MLRRMTLAAVFATTTVVCVTGTAHAADPEVFSVLEAQEATDVSSSERRPVLIVFGNLLTRYRSVELRDVQGAPVGTAQLRLKSKNVLVVDVDPSTTRGKYTLALLPARGDPALREVTIARGGVLPGTIDEAQLTTALKNQLADAETLGGNDAAYYRNASNLNAGTLSTDLYSAIQDLTVEGRIGKNAGQVAAGDHTHAGLYLEPSMLSNTGTINQSSNPVHWTQLRGVPAAFADGTDDVAVYTAGTGLTLTGTQFAVDLAGTGIASAVARSDHDHDAWYYRRSDLDTGGTLNDPSNPVVWTRLKGVPAGFADGLDDANVYTAGSGLSLSNFQFSVGFGGNGSATSVARSDHDHDAWYYRRSDLDSAGTINASGNPVAWTRLKGVPSGFADGVDDDTLYTSGSGLQLTGTQFAVDFGGNGTATTVARGDHNHDVLYAALVHNHDSSYYRRSELDTGGILNDSTNPVVWTRLKGVPTGIADGVDNDTTYAAGTGLSLSSGSFSILFAGTGSASSVARSDHDHDSTYPRKGDLDSGGTLNDTANPITWTKLRNVPTGFADGVDNDTQYTAGAGIVISSSVLSVDFGTSGTATTAARSDHTHTGWVLKSGDTMTGALSISTSSSPALSTTSTSASGVGLDVYIAATGTAIRGVATNGTSGVGVHGTGNIGVYGVSNYGGTGVLGETDTSAGKYGVQGRCQNAGGTAGVHALCTATGPSALVADQQGGSGRIADFRAAGSSVAYIDRDGTAVFRTVTCAGGTATTAAITGTNWTSGADGAVGVEGVSNATAGGVASGIGVKGAGGTIGVLGSATNGTYGVRGTGADGGVYGINASGSGGWGVFGDTLSTTGSAGVQGRISNPNGVAAILAECAADGPAALMTNHTGGSGNQAIFRTNGSNVARIDRSGKGYFNGGTQSSGADFAESVAVDRDRAEFEPGDVIVVDITSDRRFSLSAERESTLVAGVYSTKPALLGTTHDVAGDGAKLAEEIPLGIVGIVPTKVCDENGPVRRGDLLVTSSIPGHAMRAGPSVRPGTILGKALGAVEQGRGVIEVLVTLR
jgi:hypothetical protein